MIGEVHLSYTSEHEFDYSPKLPPQQAARAAQAFRGGSAVVVLGSELAGRLLGDREPLGEHVTIAGKEFEVVGVRPGFRVLLTQAWIPVSFYETMKHRTPVRPTPGVPWWVVQLDARPLDLRRYSEAIAQLRDALLPMLPQEYRKGIAFSEEIPETTKQFIFQHKAVAARGP